MEDQDKALKEARNAKRRARYHERRKDPEFVAYHRKRTRDYNRTPKGRSIQNSGMKSWRENMPDDQRNEWLLNQRRWGKKSKNKMLQDPVKKKRFQDINNNYCKKRRRENMAVKMAETLRGRLRSVLKANKSSSALDLVGCSLEELIIHLESKFSDGMSWSNHGNGADRWNVDHIIPIAAFNIEDPVEQQKAFHYTNLQPLWHLDNCAKNSIVDGKKQYYSREP